MDFLLFDEIRSEREKIQAMREEKNIPRHPGKRETDFEKIDIDEISNTDTLFETSGASSPVYDTSRADTRRQEPPEARIREIDKMKMEDLRTISIPKKEHPKNTGKQWVTSEHCHQEQRYREKTSRLFPALVPLQVPLKEMDHSTFLRWTFNLPHQNSQGLVEAVTECAITAENVTEAWKHYSSEEEMMKVNTNISHTEDLEEQIKIFASYWKKWRNIPLFQFIIALLRRGQLTRELLDHITTRYREELMNEDSSIETLINLEHLFYSQAMLMRHPRYWPSLEEEDTRQQSFSKERSRIFGKDTIEFLRLYAKYPSLQTEEEERNYAEITKTEIRARWETKYDEATLQFGRMEFSKSFLWNLTLSELNNLSTLQFANLLRGITNHGTRGGPIIQINLHEYDPELERKEWRFEEFSFNDTWFKGRRQQFKEMLRTKNLLHKIPRNRETLKELREIPENIIQSLLEELRTGKGWTLDHCNEDDNMALIQKCVHQWNADRNFTFMINSKARLRQNRWDEETLVRATQVYKRECKEKLKDIEIPPASRKAPLEEAFLLTNPKFWPCCCEEETEILMKDPEFARATQDFGEIIAELYRLYQLTPKWKDEETKLKHREGILTRIQAKVQDTLEELNIENTQYPLWTICSRILFNDFQTDLKGEIENLDGLIVISPATTTENESQTQTQRSSLPPDQEETHQKHWWDEDSESESEPESDPEPRNDTAITDKPIEEIIEHILKTKDRQEAKDLIIFCKENYREERLQEEYNMQNTIIELLANITGDKWPVPKLGACPFAQECATELKSIGQARLHLRKTHNFDTSRVRDEIHITLEYLTQQQINQCVHDFDGLPIPKKKGQFETEPPILCHFCDYEAERDQYVETHRTKIHSEHTVEIRELGLFWATARFLRKKLGRAPLIEDFLPEKETFRCGICGIHRDRKENMAQHINKKHSASQEANTQNVIVSYRFANAHEQEEQATEIEKETEESDNTVIAQYAQPTEPQREQLEQLGITEERLKQVIATDNLEAFKIMCRMVMLSEHTPIPLFIKWYMELRKEKDSKERPLFKEDMATWLWKTSEIPPPEQTYGCQSCGVHYKSEKEWWQHRKAHQTRIMDISPAKDLIRSTIEDTVLVATSTEQEFTLENQIMRCPVPGCSFCFMSMEEYEQHRNNMIGNELHIHFNDCRRKWGPFYGTLTFMIQRSQRIPTISEFLGQTSGTVTLCSTCHRLIHGKHQAVMEHYREMNHCPKRSELSYKMRIFERPTSETTLVTHFDNLVNKDRRALDELLRINESRVVADTEIRELTPEERARDEEATRVREERIMRENERKQREAFERMRAIELGLNEEQEQEVTSEANTEPGSPSDAHESVVEETSSEVMSSTPETENETSIEEEDNQEAEQRNEEEEERQRLREINRANAIILLRQERELEQASQEEDNSQRRRKINRAMSWREEGIRNEKRGYQLPKLDQPKRTQIQEGLAELWQNEIKPMIESYLPNDPEDEEEWQCFEGAIYHMEDLLRTHVMIKCGRKPKSMFRKIFPKFINGELQGIQETEAQIDRGYRIAKLIEKLTKALDEEDDTETRRLEDKIRQRLSQLSLQERIKWWNTDKVEDILKEISSQINNSEAYGKWLEDTLIQATSQLEKQKNGSINERRLQENYADNPRKTMANFIWKQERPECDLPMKTMKKTIIDASTPKEIEEDSREFTIQQLIEGDESEEAYNFITNTENIEEAITSRKWLSAAGVDGLDYSIFKLATKQAAEVIKLILETIMKCRRAPVQFKSSRTIFVFKKGDREDPKNWRPLSISNALYRIAMVVLSNYFEHCNRQHAILHEAQKGFISEVNGTAENILSVMELFHEAQRAHKSLFVTALDFQNAFGSVSHEFMINSMRKKGIATNVVDVIQNIYTGSNTRIQMREGNSSQIDLKRGVKQGCPLSPMIFNIALDTLIRDLESHREYGYKINQYSFTVQAYADDILLISDSEENMNKLIERVREFTKISGMELAPNKCVAYVYGISRAQRRFYDANIKIGDHAIRVAKKDETIRYLGAPINARKTDRLKQVKITEAEFRILLEKVTQSKLAIVQKIDAIKRFLLPKWEYEFMVNQVRAHTIDRMDRAVRVSINKIVRAKLPIAVFHASWKDGGLGIPSMKDRQQVAVIRALFCMLTSKHEKIRNLMNHSIEQERRKRKIGISEESPYLGWDITTEEGISGTRGTSSLAARSCRAIMNYGMKLSREEELEKETLKLKIQEKQEVTIKSQNTGNEAILQHLRDSWREKLAQQTFHLHSFLSLSANKNSNAFIIRASKPVKDSYMKFVIKARTNTLPTQEFKEIMEHRPHTGCPRCQAITNNSLQHLLNGCPINRRMIMDRHDSIVNHLAEELRTEQHAYVAKDARISLIQLEENRLLKPDIQFWSEDRKQVLLVEVNCPYAKTWEGYDSLKEKYETKQDKYRDLIRELRDKGVKANLMVVVVSSLGAVYKETEKEIKKMIPNLRKANKICRRISSLAILGSAKIWWNYKLKRREEEQQQQQQHTTTDSETEDEQPPDETIFTQEQNEVDIEENERWMASQPENNQTWGEEEIPEYLRALFE